MGVWEYVEVAIGFLAGIGTLLVGMKMMSGTVVEDMLKENHLI